MNPFPGSATADSDIFAVNVDDLSIRRVAAEPDEQPKRDGGRRSELVARWPEDPLHELPR